MSAVSSAPALGGQCRPFAKVSAAFDCQIWQYCRLWHASQRRNGRRPSRLVLLKKGDHDATTKHARSRRTGPARPHDFGSAANETVDGLDATTEALRHAAEDTEWD